MRSLLRAAETGGAMLLVVLTASLLTGMVIGANVALADDASRAETRADLSTISKNVTAEYGDSTIQGGIAGSLAEASEEAALVGFEYGVENPEDSRDAAPVLAVGIGSAATSIVWRRVREAVV